MIHPYHLVFMGPQPRVPVAFSLCLLLAALPVTGAASLDDAGSPGTLERPLIASSSTDSSIFAWEIQPTPDSSGSTGSDAGDARDTQMAAAGGNSPATDDEIILRIINGASKPASAFWDTNKTWSGLIPAPADDSEWNVPKLGELKDDKSGASIPAPAGVGSGEPPAPKAAPDQTPSQGLVMALFCVALVTVLAALLAYCAVVSCVSAACGKLRAATPNFPAH
jgi:hypothetical protein